MEDFQGSKTILYEAIRRIHVIIHLSKTIECTPGVNAIINHGLQVIMMTCQCRLCHKCIILVGDADSGEALHCGGRDLWEVSVPSTQFCFKPKDPKSKSLFLEADIWRSQDGGGVGRGGHFLSYKFIKRITEHRANFTKQLLIAS